VAAPVVPPLVVGSGAPVLPSLVVGSGSPVLAVVMTVVSPGPLPLLVPSVSVPVPVSLPVEVGGGPWDTAPGEQSHSPKPSPAASHVRRPSRPSAQGHGCVSPGTHDHGGTSGGSPLVLFMSSLPAPGQASPAAEASKSPSAAARARRLVSTPRA